MNLAPTQVISQLPHHNGGLTPIALGLFHPSVVVRNATVDLIDRMQQYPVRLHEISGTTRPGTLMLTFALLHPKIGIIFLGKLSLFQQLTYQRLVQERSNA